jgi:hypothetical protein
MVPHQTRNTSVLFLSQEILVSNLVSKEQLLDCYAISSAHIYKDDLADTEGRRILGINFWSHRSQSPVIKVDVKVPQGWSARMYLAAIRSTIDTNGKVLIIHKANSRRLGQSSNFTSVNELHKLYRHSNEIVNEWLLSEGYILML